MNTHEEEGLTFEDVEALMVYVDMKLVEGLSRLDLARRLKSPVQRNFCIKSVKKEKKQPDTKQTKEDFRQLSGLKAKVSSGIAKSSSMSVLTNSNTIQTTLKVSQATSSSKIDTSDDDWAKFADEYDLYGISVNDNC